MDVYQTVTDTIIKAIENNPGQVQMPWQRFGGQLPENGSTGVSYRGVNILNLWCEAQLRGFTSNQWCSYKQWSETGAQVRKGEKSSLIVFYKSYKVEVGDEEEERRVLKWSYVFNADQVDGYERPDIKRLPPIERLDQVEQFVKRTGAIVKEGGGRACYVPALDIIHMPDSERFIDTKSRNRTEAFYSVLMHELTHWSGAEKRLARDLKNRFGSEAYAAEELVAELGAAFLCAKLDISPEVRLDHASYLNNWLQVLKSDKKSIFKAAAEAQKATEYLLDLA